MITKNQNCRPSLLERIYRLFVVASVVLVGLLLLITLFTHFPFFDEAVQVRMLWYIASGFKPDIDFFGIYPSLGFVLTAPFMNMFAKSAYVLLALRCISLMITLGLGFLYFSQGRTVAGNGYVGLPAFLLLIVANGVSAFFSEYSIDHMATLVACCAFVLIFTDHSGPLKLFSISFLAMISLMIMPKYMFPLAGGCAGIMAVHGYRFRKPLQTVSAAMLGVLLAGLLCEIILRSSGDSIINNFNYAFLRNYYYTTSIINKFGTFPFFSPTIIYFIDFLRDNILLAALFLLGIAGWAKRSWRKFDEISLGGTGILAGMILSCSMVTVYCEQYLVVVAICLSLFVPCAVFLVESSMVKGVIQLLIIVGTMVVICSKLNFSAEKFNTSPISLRAETTTSGRLISRFEWGPTAVQILEEYSKLLNIVPENERIVAAWPFHPLFRRDQTFLLYDDPISFTHMIGPDSPLKKHFETGTFNNSMEQSPPALIVLEGLFPPGWQEVADDFIHRHDNEYSQYKTGFINGYVRNDLLKK